VGFFSFNFFGLINKSDMKRYEDFAPRDTSHMQEVK